MRTFQDNAGRTWTVTLNIWAVKKVRDLLGVDLLDLSGSGRTINPTSAREGEELPDGLLCRLLADPILLVDVLYVVCKEQADGANVTDEQFGRSMAGDAIDAATRAFLEELADFTPSPRDRARAKRVIEATWKLIDRAQDVLDARADAQMEKAAEVALSALGSSSGSSPASSEPIPAG